LRRVLRSLITRLECFIGAGLARRRRSLVALGTGLARFAAPSDAQEQNRLVVKKVSAAPPMEPAMGDARKDAPRSTGVLTLTFERRNCDRASASALRAEPIAERGSLPLGDCQLREGAGRITTP